MPEEVVYVLGAPGGRTVKIGRTTNLSRRAGDIQRMSPVPLAVLWTHPGGSELESRLHRHFAAQRQHGEWFSFNEDPVPIIEKVVMEAACSQGEEISPRSGGPSPAAEQLLQMIDEVADLLLAQRADLEETIAGARRAGCSLTAISEHTPFSREWVRRIADRVDGERATA